MHCKYLEDLIISVLEFSYFFKKHIFFFINFPDSKGGFSTRKNKFCDFTLGLDALGSLSSLIFTWYKKMKKYHFPDHFRGW